MKLIFDITFTAEGIDINAGTWTGEVKFLGTVAANQVRTTIYKYIAENGVEQATIVGHYGDEVEVNIPDAIKEATVN
jgi:hypothetical protein